MGAFFCLYGNITQKRHMYTKMTHTVWGGEANYQQAQPPSCVWGSCGVSFSTTSVTTHTIKENKKNRELKKRVLNKNNYGMC